MHGLISQRSGQRLLHAINRLYARLYHNVEVLAPPQIPKQGPAILVCNHTSGLDPELIQSCCGRVITWMMAREYYELPVLRFIFDTVGVIPVSRGGRDTAATRAAMRALADGKVLGVFPEGKIETTDELLPFQAGVALLAMKSEAPVCPAYLDGTQRGKNMKHAFARPQRATLTFGAPMRFSRAQAAKSGADVITKTIENAVRALRDQTHKACLHQTLH
jgi:1-acyl-sn-glycerol-3-phosphate acyltransferase